MKPKEFLEWWRYRKHGGKRMHDNYKLLRKHRPKEFMKLQNQGRFDDKDKKGKILQFPEIRKENV
jgi:hypothetical protein